LVLLAVKSGAFDPILTIGASFERSTLEIQREAFSLSVHRVHPYGFIARVNRDAAAFPLRDIESRAF
jgi:hypothetical protein